MFFCGKTYLLLKILTGKGDFVDPQDIVIITRSPEQYENSEYCIEENINDLEEYKNKIVVFDDMLDHKQKEIEPFFTRRRHKDIDVYHLSQIYFVLPLQTIRNNSNIIILFKQTKNGVQHIYDDIAGLDMNYDEWKELCKMAWEE